MTPREILGLIACAFALAIMVGVVLPWLAGPVKR